jgi:aryl-alcohol dehydrogenase-like predicted oxidoreductase
VTPISGTLETLDELVRNETVRAIGASNFSAEQIEEADAAARSHDLTPFVAIQNEYSLLVRDAERDVLPLCEKLGLGFVPYFPLASGLLTGKYRRGASGPAGARLSSRGQVASDEQFDLLEALERYAGEHKISMTELAIGALLAQPAVSSVIAGATKSEQVRANAAAAQWSPSEEDLSALADVLRRHIHA